MPSLLAPEVSLLDTDAPSEDWCEHWGISGLESIRFRAYDGLSSLKLTIFHRIRQLSFIRSKADSIRDLPPVAQQRFTNEVLLLERQINEIVHSPGVCNLDPLARLGCVPFYSSVLLFIYLTLRELPINSSILDNFVTRLRSAVERLRSADSQRQFPPQLLLWILFIGGWAADGRSDRTWYSQNIACLAEEMNVQTWEQAKNMLAEYIFAVPLCERPCKLLWDESRLAHYRR